MVKRKKKKPDLFVVVLAMLYVILVAFSIYLYFGMARQINQDNGDQYSNLDTIVSELKKINGTVYNQTLRNHYNVSYSFSASKASFEINNPCIILVKAIGESMLPYWEDENLVIVDTCYDPQNLKIGDVISYDKEWAINSRIHHRIMDIDHTQEWVKTRGDNNDGNDDFVGFDRIHGKDIGFLNVFSDKDIVLEEIVNDTNDSLYIDPPNFEIRLREQTCVCSSTGLLKICGFEGEGLFRDNFVLRNNLTEENCKGGADG